MEMLRTVIVGKDDDLAGLGFEHRATQRNI